MKKVYKKSQIIGGVALVAFTFATVLMVLGLSNTVGEVKEAAIARTPDAILASAGLDDGKIVSLPVTYYDQKADECVNVYDAGAKEALAARQFEWTKCEYYNKDIEQGLVDYYLNEEYLPDALEGGELIANKGIRGDNFEKWFNEVEGQSASYAGVLQLEYREAAAEFSFYKSEFYPLDDVGELSEDRHNHLFTMSFAVPFTVLASGNEEFEITADDDTWVYVGDELVVDMGGVHNAATGRFAINEMGEVYAGVEDEDLAYTGVQVTAGEGAMVRIFHADRDSEDSVFDVKFVGMNLAVEDSKFAKRGEEGAVQIAYDPSDPTYVAPLGVTSVVQPSAVGGFVVVATLEGVFVVVFALLMAISLRFMVKVHRDKKELPNR
ncbi:fibro-slime domain-containing protein [Candidatus Saccharibacteria bacterium]|nr:fibro-slime domain-containing protein [Candidatus Saccharibacteria bacterium]